MTELLAERIRRYLQLNVEPEMVVCSTCAGKGYHHGFGEDGRDPDWCEACGGPGKVLHPDADVSPDDLLRDAESALSEARAEITRLQAELAAQAAQHVVYRQAYREETQADVEEYTAQINALRQQIAEKERAAFEAGFYARNVSWLRAWVFTPDGRQRFIEQAHTAYQLQQTQQPKDGEN
jgi:hypothetical protein